jgi:hypothetical protein
MYILLCIFVKSNMTDIKESLDIATKEQTLMIMLST